jgi:7,8-dihydropterin-6-yl-methyl-4-(beta-D-ribofuranosyl)aminobenzene 5'-phosphate synthase
VLFDTGVSPTGMVENMRRLGLSPGDIEAIVLSHGHWDHVTGMGGLVHALGRASLPVLIHPEFWSRRRLNLPGIEPVELPSTSRWALEGTVRAFDELAPAILMPGHCTGWRAVHLLAGRFPDSYVPCTVGTTVEFR